MLCVICNAGSNAEPGRILFGPAARNNLKQLLNRSIEDETFCFTCYIKVGTAAYLMNTYLERLTKYGQTYRQFICYLCNSHHRVELYDRCEKQYFEFLNIKLRNIRKHHDFVMCHRCDILLTRLNELLVLYHNSKQLPIDSYLTDSDTISTDEST